MKTRLPFTGFYNSIYELYIEREFETDEDGEDCEAREDVDMAKLMLAIAKDYTEFFAFHFNLKLTFESLLRPREYNFLTDEIVVDLQGVADLYKRVNQETLKAVAREKFTSRSGFVSFYSPNVERWGSIDTWDYNQVSCLLEALLLDEGFTDSGAFDDYYCDRTGSFEHLLWR